MHIDQVQRLFGGPDHPSVLDGDVAGDPQRSLVEFFARHHLVYRPEVVQGGGVDSGRGEEQPPHHVLRHQARQVGGRAQRAAFDFGQAERRIVGCHDHVGVAHQADTAADAESVDGGDHRHGAFVDRAKGREAAAVGLDQGGEAFGALHLFDVHPGVEAAALGAQDHGVSCRVVADGGQHLGELEPALRRDGVDGGKVDGDGDDPRFDGA